MLYCENSQVGFALKLNNLTGQKFGMSELKLSWSVTLTGDPPANTSRPVFFTFHQLTIFFKSSRSSDLNRFK